MTKGDKVWFFDSYDNIWCGKIRYERGDYFHVKCSAGAALIHKEDCFASKEDCVKAHFAEAEKQISEYMSTIHNPADLIKFMYNHVVCPAEEYTDWEAREAAKRKAMEFGVNLSEND